MTRDGKTYYYQTNYRGDVLALTDSSGNVVATYEYDAFGRLLKETGTVENPYRYAGYRYDKETGLYYLQSRYYNPEMGRFLTRDVFEGFLNETLSVNKYVYTENNPVMSIDPDGYWKKTIYLSKKTMWKILATGAGIGVVLVPHLETLIVFSERERSFLQRSELTTILEWRRKTAPSDSGAKK